MNQTLLDTLNAEFVKHEINNTDGSPTGNISETGYNNISSEVFPVVMPYVNLINNSMGPYSFHFTLDLHGEADNYK